MAFRLSDRSTLIQACALAVLAVLAGLVSNRLASRDRSLHWLESPPPPSSSSPVEVQTPSSQPSAQPAPQSEVKLAPQALFPEKALPLHLARPGNASPISPEAPGFPPEASAPVRDISSAEAQRAFRLKLPFLDARRSSEFSEGHVANAWSLPVWESDLEARITIFEATTKVTSKDPLVIYCSGGDCEDSHMLATKLMALGYRNLLIYRLGYPDWVRLGQPVERGTRP